MAYKKAKVRYTALQWTEDNMDEVITTVGADNVRYFEGNLAVYATYVPPDGWIVMLEDDDSFEEVKSNEDFGDIYEFTL